MVDTPIENEELATRLGRLAQDKSQQARGVLLENIAELFVGGEGELSDHEQSLITDILSKLLHEVEMTVRQAVAERLCQLETIPRDLVVLFANDDIQVAGPILHRSRVLQDPDLMEIILHRSMEHRLAIAAREGVSEAVADALVACGEEDVIETLLRNDDAVLSRQACEYLVEESRRLDRFQGPLLRRPDLPPELTQRMFWWVSAALRQYILANFTVDEATLDDIIQDSVQAGPSGPSRRKAARTDAEKLATRLQEQGELNEQFLVRSLRQQHVSAFIAGLACLAGLDITVARRIVFDEGGEPLTVVCKALGIDRSDFASIFLLTRQAAEGGGAKDPLVVETMLRIYDGLKRETAGRALRFWRRDADYLGAIAAIDQPGFRAGVATKSVAG
jgi:uncharacterized protein (DUF2336 family)